jgi:hypothetical protein
VKKKKYALHVEDVFLFAENIIKKEDFHYLREEEFLYYRI